MNISSQYSSKSSKNEEVRATVEDNDLTNYPEFSSVSDTLLDLNQFTFCTKTNISQISFDLSGVAFNHDVNRLVVVENGTPQAMELDLDGTYIRTINFNNFEDTEGITYAGNNRYFVTEERKRDIVLITIPPGNSNITINHPGVNSRIDLGNTGGNDGLEGVAYDADNDIIYTVKEKFSPTVFKVTNAMSRLGTSYSPPIAFDFNVAQQNYPGNYTDLAGTALTSHGTLLLLTQEGQHVVEVDPDNGLYLSDMSLSAASTPQPEGIVVLNNGELIIVGEANEFLIYNRVGGTCDDGDSCTTNDVVDVNCNCVGTMQDADGDGICDGDDSCPNLHNDLIGTSCSDSDVCTVDDKWGTDCNCTGIFQDSDNDGICDAEDDCSNFDDTLIGTSCSDNYVCTVNDVWTSACNCEGLFLDTDNDGTCDSLDPCPTLHSTLIGVICSDGDRCTIGDTWRTNCQCMGFQLQDSDLDGTCDIYDSCPQVDNAIFGTACDDNDPCTLNDVWQESTCACSGTTFDSDGDGICDALDNCIYIPNSDQQDTNADGIGDACDSTCATDINQLDNYDMLPGTTQAVIQVTTNRVLHNPHHSTYMAGQSVKLISGFEVKLGATFNARIEACQ